MTRFISIDSTELVGATVRNNGETVTIVAADRCADRRHWTVTFQSANGTYAENIPNGARFTRSTDVTAN